MTALSVSLSHVATIPVCIVTGYIPIRTPARKLTATPTPMAGTPTGFFMQTEDKSAKYVDNQPKGNLPFLKPEDAQYFDKLLVSWVFVIRLFGKREQFFSVQLPLNAEGCTSTAESKPEYIK